MRRSGLDALKTLVCGPKLTSLNSRRLSDRHVWRHLFCKGAKRSLLPLWEGHSIPEEHSGRSVGTSVEKVSPPRIQERKGHINLRKMPGTPAGCPWDTRRDKRGSTGRCPRDFLLIAMEKTDRKGHFSRDTGRVS